MVEEASAVPHALHSDLEFLDEHGGALLRRPGRRIAVRAGSFTTVAELVDEITAYLAHRNENPKPYQWKADGAKTLTKIHRVSGGTRAGQSSYIRAIVRQDTS